jgi:hypothetical protein
MIEMKKSNLAGAPQHMLEKGRETDNAVLKVVRGHPGLGISDIAKKLGWTNGRVDGSVNRLISEEKVKVMHFSRKGILIKKVFPIGFESKSYKAFEIPKDLIINEMWRKEIFAYAVSRSTIGLSPIPRKEWALAPIKDRLKVQLKEDTLQIDLPDAFVDFYKLNNSETSLSIMGDLAMITVEATVIPVDVPQISPETFDLERQYVRFEETVEKTTRTTTYRRLSVKLGPKGVEGKVRLDMGNTMNDLATTAPAEETNTSMAKLIKKALTVS